MATILIVDDETNTRVLLNSILENELGHELFFSPDGAAAIEMYPLIYPDLVITDLVMPRLNGVRLIEHLKAVYPDSKIMAMSGRAPEQLERAEAAGAMATLTMPIQRNELLAAVERALADPGPG